MPHKPVPLEVSIERKITWAEDCFREFGDLLLREEDIARLLKALEKAARNSHREMAASGVAGLCRECDQREGGSCCGAGLEDHYSGPLLLINRLLGADIPEERHDPSSCFFLGEGGCLLPARHVICVNYLCKKITDRIAPRELSPLREKEGIELEYLFLLNEALKKVLRSAGGEAQSLKTRTP
jgi:hypothetical protein